MGQFESGCRAGDRGENILLTRGDGGNSISEDISWVNQDMTLVVGIKAQGAIVMGSDSRELNPKNQFLDGAEKLFLYDSYILGMAGRGNTGMGLLRKHDEKLRGNFQTIDEAASEIWRLFSGSYQEWFPFGSGLQQPGLAILLAGYKNEEPVIYSLDSAEGFHPAPQGKSPAFSGHGENVQYLSMRHFDESLSRERASLLAYRMIAETAATNTAVGGEIRLATIQPGSRPERLKKEELEAIRLANDRLNHSICETFIKLKISPISQT